MPLTETSIQTRGQSPLLPAHCYAAPVSGDDVALAKQLHQEHCIKYGVKPDWNECDNGGIACWIRKAIRLRQKRHNIRS
jgi:hypothetical protein